MGTIVGKDRQPQPPSKTLARSITVKSNASILSSDYYDPTEESNVSVSNLIVSSLSFNIHNAVTYEQALTNMWQNMPNKPRLSFEDAFKAEPTTVVEFWKLIRDTSYKSDVIGVSKMSRARRWKTIRLFVSSTFRDFHAEREVLVKKVFPELRIWCEARRFHLVDCDLRWGVPKDTTSEKTIRICMSELDRCYEDNIRPFFLNMISDRVGWIPPVEEISSSLAREYGWIKNASVTEMEIIHGAIRKYNPNALFMMRDPSYLHNMPDNVKQDFIEEDDEAIEKVKALKTCLRARFKPENIIRYQCEYSHIDPATGRSVMTGLYGDNSVFAKKVLEHFKHRISKQYPMNCKSMSLEEACDESHETFLVSRSSAVFGRDAILQLIQDYIFEQNDHTMLTVCGEAGAGKSAVIAKSAEITIGKLNQRYHLIGKKKWTTFYHFIGAVPGSTDIGNLIQRFLKRMEYKGEIPTDMDALIRLMANVLSSTSTKPVIIFIDAINQLDDNLHAQLMTWLPQEPSPNVKIIVSVITDTIYHKNLMLRAKKPKELNCDSLEMEARAEIVKQSLAKFNKQLDEEQMAKLLSKKGSSNPLWLSIACEELRIFGIFDKVTEKIDGLADDVVSLLEQILMSFEQDIGGSLLVATVCLLECSRYGLLETELLSILGGIGDELDSGTFETIGTINGNLTFDESRPLPAAMWAIIYRSLRPYLRPCGDSGEGRLDFYHRSVSKAVRKRYFSGEESHRKQQYIKWHKILAGYFETADNIDRKAEELPYHLEKLDDPNRLARCLLDWPVFMKLSKEENNSNLLKFWSMIGGYDVAAHWYEKALAKLEQEDGINGALAEKKESVTRFLCRAGQLSAAKGMIEEVIDIETSLLGKRNEELADLLQLSAEIHSEMIRLEGFIGNRLHKNHLTVIELARNSIKHRKSLTSREHLFQLGKTELLLALHCGGLARTELTETNDSRPKYKNEADIHCQNALRTFEKLADIGHVAECYMTSAVFICELGSDIQLETYKKAYNLCKQAYGDDHILMLRIQNNMGIMYEHKKEYQLAYQHYKRWYEICINVLGPKHPKTTMAYKVLLQPKFKNMTNEQNSQQQDQSQSTLILENLDD
ncbi:Telomerase protein component 1 [Trichoplax sp. H2]|uniref:Uncharacterized protein n=1 Tax=Trichoplax adhaerens TaxID=10228 RepID=B3RL59_TRIAD|nr:hypothetical protein TRIADDRAFT_51888 [Trichoplax adhaerens]EDV28707.1 hypothetical protein TRIADDRAFT_51888 [Trichoplax adhaerens]RDD45012.1 Telomerase protein component 1 [Trichoplax sp. H2]|eukprot:XP_002107909.1 hypothetical protein TRIADDRAFT_51888 [Trichoplax adhaerens]